MTNDEEAEIRAYVAERAAARARGEHIDSDERREAALIAALDEARAQLAALHARAAPLCIRIRAEGGHGHMVHNLSEDLDATIRSIATAAAEHERRVRADERVKALREAADDLDARGESTRYPSELGPQAWNPSGTLLTEAGAAWCDAARKLRAMADERGAR